MISERTRKRAHIAMLRDRAIARVYRDGRHGGNYMFKGRLICSWELNKFPWTIEFNEPRYPNDYDYPELSSNITVRFKGEPVLKVVFDDERSRLGKYVPGAWEKLI